MRQNAEKGFRLLMASYKEPVYWHIRRLVVSHTDAQDAAQETFVRIFRNFQQYNETNSFKAWIFRIATNEALRLLGRQKGDMMLSLDENTATEKPKQKARTVKMATRTILATAAAVALFFVVTKNLPTSNAQTDSFDHVELAYNNLSNEDQEYLMEVYEEDVFLIDNEMNY